MKRVLLFPALLVLLAVQAWAASTLKMLEDTATAPGTITFNSIASNAFTATSAYVANTLNYPRCRVQMTLAFGSNPAANSAVYLWFLETYDAGTTTETVPPASAAPPSLVIPIAVATTSVQTGEAPCPPGGFKVIGQMSGTGVTTSSSGNGILIKPYTYQMQ